MPKKIIRITTVPLALRNLLRGQMKFMSEHGFDVTMISAYGSGFEEVINIEQCPYIIVPMTRRITPLRDLQCLFKLYRIFKKIKPDIVHSHTPKAGLLGMIAAALCGIKIRIHTVAGLPLMTERGFKLKLLRFTEKLTYLAANNVWPNSPSLYNYIVDYKLSTAVKLKVIGKGSSNGIDLSRFDPSHLDSIILDKIKDQLNFDHSTNYILFMGRLVLDKGIKELVQVFCKIQPDYSNLKLILVGSYEQDLDPLPLELIEQIENNPSIFHVNWTENGAYYMSIAHSFVFPSHREGFPNVVLQAGAMNLPVIASKIPGNIDIVRDGETGLLFNAGDEELLYQKIIYSLANREKMNRMAEKLKQIIISDFPQEKIWKLILMEYDKLIHKVENEVAK